MLWVVLGGQGQGYIAHTDKVLLPDHAEGLAKVFSREDVL